MKIPIGDYVLATKWSDGLGNEPWAIGFLAQVVLGENGTRHMIADSDGKIARPNGYRRIGRISAKRGAWLLSDAAQIEMGGRSSWGIIRKPVED